MSEKNRRLFAVLTTLAILLLTSVQPALHPIAHAVTDTTCQVTHQAHTNAVGPEETCPFETIGQMLGTLRELSLVLVFTVGMPLYGRRLKNLFLHQPSSLTQGRYFLPFSCGPPPLH